MRADIHGLNAVQAEIKQGLDRVRQALEAFIEEEADRQALATCLDDLHQIHGTLKVVRLHAAAQLADDLQQALQAVIDEQVEPSEELFEVAFGAGLQLADYLDYVPQASEDTNLLLLPVINELRVALQQPVLGEDDLFVQVLCSDPLDGISVPGAASGGDLQQLAARSLAPFQSALLGVLRQAQGDHAQRLQNVAADLQAAGGDAGSQRLWWLTAAIAEALGEDSLVAGVELKRLLGRLGQLLRNMAQQGAAALDREALALEYGLLYHVGRSTGRGELVTAVREAYALDSLLPSVEALAHSRERLRGPNTALLNAVTNEIRSDLAMVKDNLDLLMRSGELSDEHSQQTSDALRRVGATLGMLGLEDLQRVVERQAGVIESAQQQPDPASSEWQAVASSLLWIEHSLDTILLQHERGEDVDAALAEPSADAISPRELQAGAQSILREAVVNLGRVREQLEQFVREGEASGLEEAPRLLHEISAGLVILQRQEAAALVARLGQALERDQWPSLQGNSQQLDRLADALADAEKMIQALRMEEQDSSLLLRELEGYVQALEGRAAPEAASESFLELELPEAETEAQPEAETAAPASANKTADVVDGIREIFLEEMEDIQLDLSGNLPAWERDTSDLAALGEVRRSFHTLKGSGRMAGAEAIGAFGWAVEQLLNRCLEAELPVSPEIVALVRAATDEIPALAQAFAEDQPLPHSVRDVVLQAHALSDTEAPAELLAEDAAAATEEALPAVTDEPAAVEADEIELEIAELEASAEDEEDIRQIFLADALGHMEVVGQFLADAGSSLDPVPVSREVVRAFHTLKSGAALAELSALSDLCRALEALCDACLSQNQPMGTEMLQVVQHAGEDILATLEAVQSGNGLPELAGLTEEVEELHSLLAADAGAELSAEQQAELLAFTNEAASLLEQIESRLSSLEMDSDNPDEQDRLLAAMRALGDLAQSNDVDAVARVADRMYQTASVDMSDAQRQTCADVTLEIYGLLDELRQNRRDLQVDDLLARFEGMPQAVEAPPAPEPPLVTDAQTAADEAPAGPAPAAAAVELESDEMLELFLGEGEELLEGIDHALDDWEKDLQASAPRAELLRYLHTIKGGARMAGAMDIGDASHELESRIEAQQRSGEAADKAFLGDLRNNVDQIHGLMDRFRAAPQQPAEPAEPAGEPKAASALAADAPSSWAESLYWQPDTDAMADRATAHSETARVPVERLDDMLNEAGEINIYRGRLEQQHADLVTQLGEFDQAVERLRNLLRELDIQADTRVRAGSRSAQTEGDRYDEHFDPLEMDRYTRMNELSRALNESAADLASLHGLMDETTHDAEMLLLQQGRITTSLQHGLMDTLLVPFTRQVQRLQRVVRQVSQSSERATRVEFQGEDHELDRNVLDRMIGPLEHLLRNAVIHGIESADERSQAGKSEEGLIRVVLRRDGTQSILEISDDGRGLDAAAIREQAEKRGMIPKGTGLDDDLLWQFIFEPGFSTADAVTQEAGRGVGMDVVNAEIKQLGGTISVVSTPGQGTRFTIRIPSSLAITNALLVRVGGEQYAIPMASIDGVERIERETLSSGSDGIIEYGGNQYQVAKLSDYLGTAHAASDEDELKSLPVLLIQAGETPLALVVDKVLGGQELVVKSLGPQVSAITGLKGGAILSDGGVVLILDIQALHQMQRRRGLVVASADDSGAEQLQDERPMVMVVDDSITIRRVTEKFLLRNGYRVCTAKDGMDALPKLQTESPDLVLLDIEMPRIDGFELATYMRNNEHFAGIPIIMITSRSGEKHQRRAAEIGVQEYMIKPYQEDALLRSIDAVLQRAGETA